MNLVNDVFRNAWVFGVCSSVKCGRFKERSVPPQSGHENVEVGARSCSVWTASGRLRLAENGNPIFR